MINRVPKTFWLFVALLAGLAIVTAFVNGQEMGTMVPKPQDDCDTCGCAGLIDAGPMELSSGRLIKVWIDDGSMAQLSKADTRRLLLKGVKEFDEVCGLDFQIVDREAGAKVRVKFVPDMDVLGRAYTSGRINLNSTRKLGNAESRRILEALICHEMGHVFGLSHGTDRAAIMHPHLGYDWKPAEVTKLIRIHGLPEANDEPWHPTDRIKAGVVMREAVDQFGRADQAFRTVRNRRNALVGVGGVDALKAANDVVRTKLEARTAAGNLVAQRHREWWAINKTWNTSGVKGFVRLGQ